MVHPESDRRTLEENLVENVYVPHAPAFPEEFVEASDNGLVLFGYGYFLLPIPDSRAYASDNRYDAALGILSWPLS